MKWIHILTVGFIITFNGSILAQDEVMTVEKDTTGTDLNEIVVEGRSQRIIQDGIEYIPDKNTKRLSADAIGLLSNMLIPNLRIESENSITTNFGDEVKIFIDYMPADKKDISGLNTQDVLRVEVLDYPSDARFSQAEHVVNFIMKKYEWGGYTKLMLNGRVLTDEMVSGDLYQKFSYKNWVFDLAASGSGEWSHNYSNYQQENFNDFFYGDNHFDNISKTSSTDKFKERSDGEGVSFRFGYGQENYVISHTLSFSHYAVPESTTDSHVEFSDTLFNASSSNEYNNYKQWNTYINGYYYFSLPKDNSLQVNWTAGLQGDNSYSEYILESNAPIITRTNTSFSFFNLDVNYVKTFANNHTLGLRLFSNNNNWNTTYEDKADGNQKQLNSTQMITADYRKQWNFGLNLMVRAGASYHLMRENGRNNLHHWSPYLFARLNYSFNPKNRVSVSGSLYDGDVMPDMTTDLRIRKNEMMWIEGNPLLRNPQFRWVSAKYSFIPSNIFNISANIMYRNNRHVTVYDYYTEDGFDGIIRSVNDNNTMQRLEGYIYMGVNLFKRTFAISGEIEGVREILTGSRSMTNNYLAGTLAARWNYRNISLRMFYWFPATTIIYNQMGSRMRQPQQYGLSATYRIGDFLASVKFNNWFSQGQRRVWYDSAHYDYDSQSWSRTHSRLLSISLQYTFNYGKKVDHNDELEAPSGGGAGASILK